MITEQQIVDDLDSIMVPGVMRSLKKMNLLRDIKISDGKVELNLANAALTPILQETLKNQIVETIKKSRGIQDIDVSFLDAKPKDINEIKKVIAIMSGKGGVGKSLVSSLVSVALRRQGYEIGILDADITGPSIPRMFGITERPSGSESGLLPVTSKTGIEIMSINLLLPAEDDAVIWRGPLIGGAIKQFWEDVLWGKLDFMIVDLPPGTADAPLTVMQSLPITGVIVVFSPQELTAMVVRKAVKMAKQMNIRILGVIENLSYLYVQEINKKIEIFGKSRGQEMANTANAPLIGQLPLDPELAKLCDAGNIERYDIEKHEGFVRNLNEILLDSQK